MHLLDPARPFDDQAHRQRRREQREVVLQFSPAYVEEVSTRLMKAPEGFSGHAERWLRDRADNLIKANREFFDEVRSDETALQVAALLKRVDRSDSGYVNDARHRTEDSIARPSAGPWTDRQGGDVVHLIELLTWADDIADDGYTTRPS